MKRTLAMGMAVAALAAMVTGCASAPSTPAGDASLASRAAGKTAPKAYCVRDTGSRIKVKEGECKGPGRTYSQQELESTGETDPLEALKKLDPSIR